MSEPDRRLGPKRCVLQEWVINLGPERMRHQGVLLTAVRGCDVVKKDEPVKLLARCYRAAILNCFCGDPRKAVSFVELVPNVVLLERMEAVVKNHDHYPMHYVLHLVHAAAIVGHYHPDAGVSSAWLIFYNQMVSKFHMRPESREDLDRRLMLDEESFGAEQ